MFSPPATAINLLWIAVGTAVMAMALTRGVMTLMARHGLTAQQNKRSSHVGEPLIGGGWSVVLLTLGAWLLFAIPRQPPDIAAFVSALVLAAISWRDDLKLMSPATRLLLQSTAVAICLWLLPANERVLWDGLPLAADRLVTALCWIWFINLYNFMDGIDGLAASETISVAGGVVFVGLTVALAADYLILAAALAGATAGFLPWNWHRAKIFLGDLGSVPIGFLLGFLLIHIALKGYLAAAIILPLYFVTDASITLTRRAIDWLWFEGEPFWHPHKVHFYQRALHPGCTHAHVVLRIVAGNIVLVCAAILSISQPLPALSLAIAAVAILMAHLQALARSPS